MSKEKESTTKEVVKETIKKVVMVQTNRGLSFKDGWLPAGVYEFTPQEAKNLVKNKFGKKVTK